MISGQTVCKGSDVKSRRGITLRQFCLENNLEVVIEQFDAEKNYPETVDTILAKSSKKYYFTYNCPKNHSKKQRVSDKTSKRSINCPLCQNRGAVGKSIADEYPETYAKMFNEKKNGVTAMEVPVRSGNTYWWKCMTCGNEFEGKAAYVTSGQKVCQECNNKKQSDAEKILAYYLKKIDVERICNYKIEGWKYDFYLPKYNLLIEYDGYPWHNGKRSQINDAKKDKIAIKNNFRICRLRDERLIPNKKLSSVIWKYKYDYGYKYFQKCFDYLCRLIEVNVSEIDVDVRRDSKKIHIHYIEERKRESLLANVPEIVHFLDNEDERNGDPELLFVQSHKQRLFLRHPLYPEMRWSCSVHRLFQMKENIMPRSIRMCEKIIERYPELEEEVSKIGTNMSADTLIKKNCDKCGRETLFTYDQLYYARGKHKLCVTCLEKSRMNNLQRGKIQKIDK